MKVERTFYILRKGYMVRCDYWFDKEGIIQLPTRGDMARCDLTKPNAVSSFYEVECPRQNKVRNKFDDEEDFIELEFFNSPEKERLHPQIVKAPKSVEVPKSVIAPRTVKAPKSKLQRVLNWFFNFFAK